MRSSKTARRSQSHQNNGTTRADEMWHIDTTVIRLLDGTRAYLHAVIDTGSPVGARR